MMNDTILPPATEPPASEAPVQRPVGLNGTGTRVLDPCSGSRMMWFDRGHPDAVFGDRRSETLTVTDRSHGKQDGTRTLTVCPDMLMDFRALPFPEASFRLVAFDPPHLVRGENEYGNARTKNRPGSIWRCIERRQDVRDSFQRQELSDRRPS